jgi:hypothetical protein
MTEEEWLSATDPQAMLDFLWGKASDRKLRLFAVACCRRIWPLLIDERSRRGVELAEQFADFLVDLEHLSDAEGMAWEVAEDVALPACAAHAARTAWWATYSVGPSGEYATNYAIAAAAEAERATEQQGVPWASMVAEQSLLLRDIFGLSAFQTYQSIERSWLTWHNGTVEQLAESAYTNRSMLEGILDPDRLAVLADALEDAGCTEAAILEHLRGPGPHWRGCWVIDALLGKT